MKAIKYFSFILFLIFSSTIYSQIPDTVWTKTFGGPLADVGNSVKQTSDGGFIVAATTSSFGAGGQDIYLIKTDENGDTLWTKTFGGIGNDRTANVVQTNDNGYAIFGTTNSFGNGGDDFLLWKTDSLGNSEWYKTYGGSIDEIAYEGHQLSDGNFVIAGDSVGQNYKAWLIKTDTNGNFVWGKTIGSSTSGHHYHGKSVLQKDNGEYVFCGLYAYPFYPPSYLNKFFFSRISTNGNLISNVYFGGFIAAWGPVVKKLLDDNLILGGTFVSYNGTLERPILYKTNQYGSVIWENIVLGSQYPALLTSLEPTNDNGFIFTELAANHPDAILMKCDKNGNFSWEKIVGGPQDDRANSINPTSDSGYIVTGYTRSFGAGDSDIWLLKFKYNPPPEITIVSPNGGELWLMGDTVDIKWNSIDVDSVKIQLSLSSGIDWITLEESTPSDSIYEWIVQAPSTSLNCLMKISNVEDSTIFDISDTTFVIDMFPSVDESIVPGKFELFQNYPNPFNPTTKIKYEIPDQVRDDKSLVTLKVYDILGNEIATLVNEEKPAGNYEVEFNGTGLTSGIYFYQLKSGLFVDTKKMVLMK